MDDEVDNDNDDWGSESVLPFASATDKDSAHTELMIYICDFPMEMILLAMGIHHAAFDDDGRNSLLFFTGSAQTCNR